jgi:uncharacterized damage-inducible protein DinB
MRTTMKDSSTLPSLKQDALGDLEQELGTTRRVLERLPEEHFGWKPHEKSMSLGRLASHVVELVHWKTMVLQGDELDLGDVPNPAREVPARTEDLLRTFDANVATLEEALEQADESSPRGTWTLRHGSRVLLSMPRVAVIRLICLNHLINHRGQLCLYLRLLNVPVPAIYGPSADEPGF